MLVITPDDAAVVTTPNGRVTRLATPSLGSAELSTWRLRMEPGSAGPVHSIDREQILMPVEGAFEITVDAVAHRVAAGQVAVLPAGVVRQVRPAGERAAEAVVCMPVGGVALLPETGETRDLPWAR
ncbi:cupin domain-containing protein [Rhizomonospora bruguierae]|uniref:cupin domain-containing protein n=1 Tax=Rhizomonospora bruguierae TaxID=1581705 RepID=UPI001BCE45B2|nr:cupin domain-containing protein [Micromonospora sp. NBRC 107566]